MKNFERFEDFDGVLGNWKVPRAPSDLSGVLRFYDGNLYLNVTIPSDSERWEEGANDLASIVGTLPGGLEVSLLNPVSINRFFQGQETTETFLIGVLLVGARCELDELEDEFITGYVLKWPALSDWFDLEAFSLDRKKENPDEFVIEYKQVEPIKIHCEDGSGCDFLFTPESYAFASVNGYRCSLVTWLSREFSSEASVNDTLKDIFHLRALFAILGQEHTKISSIGVRCKTSKDISVTLIHSTSLPGISTDFKVPLHRLASYTDIADEFEQIVSRWTSNRDKLGPVVQLYMSGAYRVGNFLEQSFLAQVQAAEVLHRKIYGGGTIPSQAKKKLIRALEAAIPEELALEDRERVVARLHHAADYSLRERIQALANPFAGFLRRASPDYESKIEKARGARNYLTHYEKESKRPTPEALFYSGRLLKVLVELNLLKLTGLTDDRIRRLASKSHALHMSLAGTD